MRSIALFLSLFALFSTLVFAAPVVPQGEISKRCVGTGCRFAASSNPSSNQDSAVAMIDAIQVLLETLGNLVGSPSGDSSTTTTTASPAPTGA